MRPSIFLRPFLVALLAFTIATGASAASPGAPTDPAIAEGVRLHDAGEYEKAIAKYKEALARDPENAKALYEMAMSYEARRDYVSAMQAAEAGLRLASPLKPSFYMLIGVKSHPNFPLSSHREIPPSRCESWTSWGGSSGVCSFFSASFQ